MSTLKRGFIPTCTITSETKKIAHSIQSIGRVMKKAAEFQKNHEAMINLQCQQAVSELKKRSFVPIEFS